MNLTAYSDGLDALTDTKRRSPEIPTDNSYRVLDEPIEFSMKSELPGVSDEAWTRFVNAMVVAPLSVVSESNALGAFAMMPRRLADLGIVSRLKHVKSPTGKTIWAADFVKPMTSNKFLKSMRAQYAVFAASMKDYDERMSSAKIKRDLTMSRAGALSVLHRAGPAALSKPLFASTRALYEKVAKIF